MVPFEANPSGITDILGIPIGQLTLSGIALAAIAFLVVALMRGLLIPKSTHERELAQSDRRAEDYKEALAISEKRGDTLEQIGVTVVRILNALPSADDEPPKGGKS